MNIDLNEFVADLPEDDPRKFLNEVMSYKGFDIASNGHYAIFQKNNNISAKKAPKYVMKTFDRNIHSFNSIYANQSLNDIKQPESKDCNQCAGTGKLQKCPECGGSGHVTFNNAGEVRCPTCEGNIYKEGDDCDQCDGDGKIYRPVNIPFVDGWISYKYFNLLKGLSDMEITKTDQLIGDIYSTLIFKIKNGFVALMQVKR